MSETRAVANPALPGTLPIRRYAYVLVATIAVLLLLPHLPGLSSDFGRSLLTQMAIAAVFALSFNVLFGETGLLSFGHAVYFGLGGYAAIHLMRSINHGLPLPIVLVPLAGAAAGLGVGIVFGAMTTKKAGTIFALISLGLGELVYAATFMLPSLFGGEEGVTASRTRAGIDFGWPLASQLQVYYAVIAWTVIAALLMYAFTRTPVGRMCNAVRDNAERVEFVGYRAQRIRLIAVAAAGLFAGLAGGLHAINYEIVSADAVSAQRSGTVLVMAYIGGANRFLGPVLGAIVITWLQSSLSDYTSAWLLYLGVFFILVIRYAPSGLAGVIATHRALLQSPARGAVLSTYGIALLPVAMIAAGAIGVIEMSYRLSTHAELGTRMRLVGLSIDAGTVWPWAGAAALLGSGLLMFRAIYPRVMRARDRAAADARRS